jgi:hypothetical protein
MEFLQARRGSAVPLARLDGQQGENAKRHDQRCGLNNNLNHFRLLELYVRNYPRFVLFRR